MQKYYYYNGTHAIRTLSILCFPSHKLHWYSHHSTQAKQNIYKGEINAAIVPSDSPSLLPPWVKTPADNHRGSHDLLFSRGLSRLLPG